MGGRTQHRWLTGYRRRTVRYERRGDGSKAFLALAAALTCYKELEQADCDTL